MTSSINLLQGSFRENSHLTLESGLVFGRYHAYVSLVKILPIVYNEHLLSRSQQMWLLSVLAIISCRSFLRGMPSQRQSVSKKHCTYPAISILASDYFVSFMLSSKSPSRLSLPPYPLSSVGPSTPYSHKCSNAQTTPKTTPRYYFDLNAISPRSAREIATLFTTSAPSIRFIDGGIIGGPPAPKADTTVSSHPEIAHDWKRPSIPISGPHKLTAPDAPKSAANFADVLNLDHISDEVGIASGLKCCFASTSKGFTALCIQAFTTASNLGVLDHLKRELGERNPAMLKSGIWGVTSSTL